MNEAVKSTLETELRRIEFENARDRTVMLKLVDRMKGNLERAKAILEHLLPPEESEIEERIRLAKTKSEGEAQKTEVAG